MHEYQVNERKGQPMETTMVLSFDGDCREREGLTHEGSSRNKLGEWKDPPLSSHLRALNSTTVL